MSAEGCIYKRAFWLYMQNKEKKDTDVCSQDAPSVFENDLSFGKSYRDAVLSKPLQSKESEDSVCQAEGQRSVSQYRLESEPQQEVRKPRKSKRVTDVKRSECLLVNQPTIERADMEDQRQNKDKKKRRITFERLVEKTKDILFSTESWEEKFKTLFGVVVKEILDLFKDFFKEGDFVRLFLSNVNG